MCAVQYNITIVRSDCHGMRRIANHQQGTAGHEALGQIRKFTVRENGKQIKAMKEGWMS